MVVVIFKILLSVLLLLGGAFSYLHHVWFYRDPRRVPPQGEELILSPADGQVVYIKPFAQGKVEVNKLGETIPLEEILKAPGWGDRGWIVGIYMSPLDVHYNYAPIEGKVGDIVHIRAKINLPMLDLWEYFRLTYLRQAVDLFSHRYRLVNERLTVFLHNTRVKVAVVEIADKFVNKIKCFIAPGQEVVKGQKISFIDRGSQVDLVIFREDLEFQVKVGQQVYGAQTIIARLPS